LSEGGGGVTVRKTWDRGKERQEKNQSLEKTVKPNDRGGGGKKKEQRKEEMHEDCNSPKEGFFQQNHADNIRTGTKVKENPNGKDLGEGIMGKGWQLRAHKNKKKTSKSGIRNRKTRHGNREVRGGTAM